MGSIINDARLAGLIDWDAIADRTRYLRKLSHWASPAEIIKTCAEQFRLDKWARQDYYIECWIEKDALIGVIENVCNDNDVPYFACRGYASASEIWRAAQRLRRHDDTQECVILYLGDHDPSGIDMVRDVQDRLDTFGATCKVLRLALNYDQVEQYNPPPNPTKMTDSRADDYVRMHGHECWELDALSPAVIRQLIEDAILERRNDRAWHEACAEEEQHRLHLAAVAENWQTVVKNLPKKNGRARKK